MKNRQKEVVDKWLVFCFLLFSQGVNAGASFYMNAVTVPIVGSLFLIVK